MKTTGILRTVPRLLVAGSLMMALAMPSVSAAFREDRFDDFDWDWSDYYRLERERVQAERERARAERERIRVEREQLQSQEEQARETGREKRRDELDRKQEQRAAEFQDYLGAKIEASRAAIRAPRDAYYRKPGATTTQLPPAARALEVGGLPYRYYEGIFYLQVGSRYIVVPAPLGAAVDVLPELTTPVVSSAGRLHYYFGTFFAARGDAFEVVKPPSGVIVDYLPDGYEQVEEAGTTLYRFGEILFKPFLVQGFLAYVTTGG